MEASKGGLKVGGVIPKNKGPSYKGCFMPTFEASDSQGSEYSADAHWCCTSTAKWVHIHVHIALVIACEGRRVNAKPYEP